MPFIQLPYPLSLDGDPARPLTADALAMQLRVSSGFIRACFDAGCPNAGGLASAAGLLRWLCQHYEKFRALVGLRALAPLDGLGLKPGTVKQLRRANALATLLEYARTRATDWRKKRQLRKAWEEVDRFADRAS